MKFKTQRESVEQSNGVKSQLFRGHAISYLLQIIEFTNVYSNNSVPRLVETKYCQDNFTTNVGH